MTIINNFSFLRRYQDSVKTTINRCRSLWVLRALVWHAGTCRSFSFFFSTTWPKQVKRFGALWEASLWDCLFLSLTQNKCLKHETPEGLLLLEKPWQGTFSQSPLCPAGAMKPFCSRIFSVKATRGFLPSHFLLTRIRPRGVQAFLKHGKRYSAYLLSDTRLGFFYKHGNDAHIRAMLVMKYGKVSAHLHSAMWCRLLNKKPLTGPQMTQGFFFFLDIKIKKRLKFFF